MLELVPPSSSVIHFRVPFLKLRIVLTHASWLEYMKLPSIQLVMRFNYKGMKNVLSAAILQLLEVLTCSLGLFGLCPVPESYLALKHEEQNSAGRSVDG